LCCLSFDLRILITSLWYLQTILERKYKRRDIRLIYMVRKTVPFIITLLTKYSQVIIRLAISLNISCFMLIGKPRWLIPIDIVYHRTSWENIIFSEITLLIETTLHTNVQLDDSFEK
jgi:hypothetical protein